MSQVSPVFHTVETVKLSIHCRQHTRISCQCSYGAIHFSDQWIHAQSVVLDFKYFVQSDFEQNFLGDCGNCAKSFQNISMLNVNLG